MNVLFINNTEETFTPSAAGIVAPHIFECCRAAHAAGDEPVVISKSSEAEPYGGVETIVIDRAAPAEGGLAHKFLRAELRLSGWRHPGQKGFAVKIARVIQAADLEEQAMILHDDPELAVFLREKFPDAFIIHHFHHRVECGPHFRQHLRRAANIISSVSAFTSRWVEEAYGIPRNEVRTIHGGVDIDRFSPAEEFTNGVTVINFLGETGVEEGADLLLKAAARLVEKQTAPFSLQMLGRQREAGEYQGDIDDLCAGLEGAGIAVRRPGPVSRAALPDELRRAHIHVVPSRGDEPFAASLVEGMACGLATVASRTGGSPEVVGDAGFLFERESVEGLARHLEQLLSNQDMLAYYSLRARARAEKFTWENTWAAFRALI